MGAPPHRRRALVLAIVRSDRTFGVARGRDGEVWLGKCIHCLRALEVSLQGDLRGHATVEHIVPRHHGGDDSLANVALACARCNHFKGSRLDPRRRHDPALLVVIATLQARRQARWRVAATPDD